MTAPSTTPTVYTDETKHTVLALLVANQGNMAKTSRESGVPESTIKNWREAHPEKMRDLATVYAREVESEILALARENARSAAKAVELSIDKAVQEIKDSPGRVSATDAARIARDMSQVQSQNIEKVLTLTGRPATITESRELVALVKSLESDGVLKVVDSTAEEIGNDS